MVQRRPGLLDAVPAGCRTELQRAFEGQLPTTRQRWFVAVREIIVAERPEAVTRPGFEVVELAAGSHGPADQQTSVALPAEVDEVLQRVALIGYWFDRLEFVGAS